MRGFVAADELSTTVALSTDALEVLSTTCCCLSCLAGLSLATLSSAHLSDILFSRKERLREVASVISRERHVKPTILIYKSSLTGHAESLSRFNKTKQNTRHFRESTKLDQKGREWWEKVARASLAHN